MTTCTVYDEDSLISLLAATTQTIGSLLPRHTELVLHDLRTPTFSIVEIVNGEVTGRCSGDSVLAGLRRDQGFLAAMECVNEPFSLLLDYQTTGKEGALLRSSTILYRNAAGRPFAALCINCDTQVLPAAIALLQQLCPAMPGTPQSRDVSQREAAPQQGDNNIESLMQEIIAEATRYHPGKRRRDVKSANLLAVQRMQERGIFLIKGGVEKAAAALSVTRYTIYNYLDELKSTQGEKK